MIETVVLPDNLRALIEGAARRDFPRECCGLVEGTRNERIARVTAIHPARNLATDADRFEIDPAEQIHLLRQLRGTGRDIIGCYHSHPNGRAEPSQRDLAGAFGEEFLWLIVALTEGHGTTLGAFEIGQETFRAVRLLDPSRQPPV
jgi:proteasome lid subunit RPN8/RPN11